MTSRTVLVYCSIVPQTTPPHSWYNSAQDLSRIFPVIFIDDLELKSTNQNFTAILKGFFWTLINLPKKHSFLRWNFTFLGSAQLLFLYLWFYKNWHKYDIVLFTNVPEPYAVFKFIPYTKVYYECTDKYYPDQYSTHASRIKTFDKVLVNTKLLADEMKQLTPHVYSISSGYSEKLQNVHSSLPKIPNSVIFSGGISHRIDYPLLLKLVQKLPDYTFFFMGEVYLRKYYINWKRDGLCLQQWSKLLNYSNVHYLGSFSYQQSINLLPLFSCGIIPYDLSDVMNYHSHPVKLYEYLAAGIPVISTPIPAIIERKNQLDIFIADTPQTWVKTITNLPIERLSQKKQRRIIRLLKDQSVHRKTQQIAALITEKK